MTRARIFQLRGRNAEVDASITEVEGQSWKYDV